MIDLARVGDDKSIMHAKTCDDTLSPLKVGQGSITTMAQPTTQA